MPRPAWDIPPQSAEQAAGRARTIRRTIAHMYRWAHKAERPSRRVLRALENADKNMRVFLDAIGSKP